MYGGSGTLGLPVVCLELLAESSHAGALVSSCSSSMAHAPGWLLAGTPYHMSHGVRCTTGFFLHIAGFSWY